MEKGMEKEDLRMSCDKRQLTSLDQGVSYLEGVL